MPSKPPITQFSKRIRNRVGNDPDRQVLEKIALRPDIQDDMLQRVKRGEKPVTALSASLEAELGERARDFQLRRVAGEMAAEIVEKRFGCVRVSGARLIQGDAVFTSGTPFGLPPQPMGDPLVAVLVGALPDDRLMLLSQAVSLEIERRAA